MLVNAFNKYTFSFSFSFLVNIFIWSTYPKIRKQKYSSEVQIWWTLTSAWPTRLTWYPTNWFNFHVRGTTGADVASRSEDQGSCSDSEDGLPPLERNVNHLSLEESDEESEWKTSSALRHDKSPLPRENALFMTGIYLYWVACVVGSSVFLVIMLVAIVSLFVLILSSHLIFNSVEIESV